MENTAGLACHTHLARRGVAQLTVPVDFQKIEVNSKGNGRTPRNVCNHVSDISISAQRSRLPCEDDLRRAADGLNAGKKVAILAGRSALHATAELEMLAEALGAPIIKALLGKAAVPDDSPYTNGTIGLLRTAPLQEAMEECDPLFIVGSSFPYIEFLPKPGAAHGVPIDLDPTRIGIRYPVGLVGDTKRCLQELLPRPGRNQRLETEKYWKQKMDERASVKSRPMKPQFVAAEVGKRLHSNTAVNCDSGTIATWWARHIPVKSGQLHIISGNFASIARGLPYTIASADCVPQPPVRRLRRRRRLYDADGRVCHGGEIQPAAQNHDCEE
jgi:pyruvate dehydrogenase (quinone)